MTAASYNCFPARTVLHPRKEGAGHWLVAYRKTEEQKHRRAKDTWRKHEKDRGADSPHENILDGPFLLQLHHVDDPFELCCVDVSEQKLTSVTPDDLKVFDNVAYVDASINSLSLEAFSRFSSLRELNLSLNGLSSLTFRAADFPHLEVLDLSYNTIPPDDIVSTGQLPRLKVLRLTGNQLHHLPPNLCTSHRDSAQRPDEGEKPRFNALEVLELDENKLSSAVFNSLINLKRLKLLNLQRNHISEIPYLPYLKSYFEEQVDESVLASTEPNGNTNEYARKKVLRSAELCEASSLPLPRLQFLNLAENMIAEEDAVMAAALFPSLLGIDICSNPLTTQRSGDPPFLTHYLQERRGIAIRRKKTQEVMKLPPKVPTGPKWKLQERLPQTPKRSRMIKAPRPQVKTNDPSREHKGTITGDGLPREDSQSCFVTQTADVPVGEFDPQGDKKTTAAKEEEEEDNKDDSVPAGFTCCQALMEAESNPPPRSVGIQTAVWMLEHKLRNLNVYRDSKTRHECIQTSQRRIEKRMKQLPPRKPVKQPVERVEEMMEEIKRSTTMRDIPLSSAIRSSGADKQEALLLLEDMKTRYKMAHKKAMEETHSRASKDTST